MRPRPVLTFAEKQWLHAALNLMGFVSILGGLGVELMAGDDVVLSLAADAVEAEDEVEDVDAVAVDLTSCQ